MRRLRESLSRPRHADGDQWDDGPLPDLTSGIMWSATGAVRRDRAVAARLGPQPRDAWRSSLAGFAIVWGLFEIWLASRGRGMPVGRRALVTASHDADRGPGALGHRRRHQLPPAGDDLHRAVHLLLLPAAARLAADGAVRVRLRHAALLRRAGHRRGLSRAARDVRAGRGGRHGRDPVPEGPPRARRGPPADDGRDRPAHRRAATGAGSTWRSRAPPRPASRTR